MEPERLQRKGYHLLLNAATISWHIFTLHLVHIIPGCQPFLAADADDVWNSQPSASIRFIIQVTSTLSCC